MVEYDNRRRQTSSGSDRRQFFRIDDAIQVSYSIVPDDQVKSRVEAFYHQANEPFSLASEIVSMRQESAVLMRKISVHSPDVAAYLASVDKRLEIMARALAAKGEVTADQPSKPCNISASGVALHVDEPVYVGTCLELKLLLMPSYIGVVVFGDVVACHKEEGVEEAPYLMRVNFTHIRESDRDLLIKHVIHRQSEMLRHRRETRENND